MTTTSPTTQISTTQIYRVYIRATPDAIWDAITQPEWTERFGYGGRAEYDLRVGGTYTGYTSPEMRAIDPRVGEIAVDGEILELDQPRKLVQTWRMVMDETAKAEGFTKLTYEIAEMPGGVSRLTVTHELPNAPMLRVLLAGEMENQGAGGGWPWVLSGLKTLLETGRSMYPDAS